MPTLTSSMNVALGALQTNQTGLATTAHNISNVNTEGFVRQQVIQENVSIGGFGDGVNIGEIRRTVDSNLETQVMTQTANYSYASTLNSSLGNVEVIFGTPGADTSTEKLVNNMINLFSTVANSPDLNSLKLSLVKSAELVTNTLNATESDLVNAQNIANTDLNNTIVNVNEALRKISELNDKVVELNTGTLGGANANDIIDERRRYMLVVAEALPVSSSIDELGRVRMQTTAGNRLVDASYVQLERIPSADPSAQFEDIGLRGIAGDGQPGTTVFTLDNEKLSGGSIKALVDVRDEEIPNLLSEVNEFAETMIDAINNEHSQGTGVPPKNQITTGNGHKLSAIGVSVTDPAEYGIQDGAQFDISVVDSATGDPVATTLGTPITINDPATLTDIANSINADPNIGGLVTAAVIIDSDGFEQLQITATDPSHGIVMKNETGNPLGKLGVNNFFTGSSAADIAVREDIVNDPTYVATARMRDNDGGVSFGDNRNILELAELSNKTVDFDAAGGFSAKSDTISGYFIGISSNLAVKLKDSSDRASFESIILTDYEARQSSVEGVNMDEELANMLIFQKSYQASARIISIIDEMLETLVNIV